MQVINDFSYIVGKCQLGAGNRQCMYLYKREKSYGCCKNSSLLHFFNKEDAIASGDNCKGYDKSVEIDEQDQETNKQKIKY